MGICRDGGKVIMKIDDTNEELEREIKNNIISKLYADKAEKFDNIIDIIGACRCHLGISLDIDEAYQIIKLTPFRFPASPTKISNHVKAYYTDKDLDEDYEPPRKCGDEPLAPHWSDR